MTKYTMDNALLSNLKSLEKPYVGMGATQLSFTDQVPCTIVYVTTTPHNVTRITARKDLAYRTDDGSTDRQTYEYLPDESAPQVVYTLRRNGHWVARGKGSNTPPLILGIRQAWKDPSL